jgi:hypothetical protein
MLRAKNGKGDISRMWWQLHILGHKLTGCKYGTPADNQVEKAQLT